MLKDFFFFNIFFFDLMTFTVFYPFLSENKIKVDFNYNL